MFLLFHYYIILIINLLSFFWENISVFWYFHQFLICSQSSLGVTLRWITCNFIVIWLGYRVSNFITNHQLLLLVELPYFLGSFKCICCRLFSIIKKSLALFIFCFYLHFCQYFYQYSISRFKWKTCHFFSLHVSW